MSVLIVAAHPDDEVLGCGGTIALHVEKGDEVNIIFLSDGVSSRKGENISGEIKKRKESAIIASQILGAKMPEFLGFPDNKLDTIALLDIIQPLELLIDKIQPSIIYTHHHGDLNIDHRITYKTVMTACRPLPNSWIKAIYSFEVLSSTEWSSHIEGNIFAPTRFIDITSTLNKKIKALEAYSEEIRDFPHSRSFETVKAQAKYRGSIAGMKAAESFAVNRLINNI